MTVTRPDAPTQTEPAVPAAPTVSRWRPYQVIAGLVLSFAVFTLLGSLILSLLGLPQDVLRWAGLIVLALVGIGLIVPQFEHLLEKPFSWIPQRQVNHKRGGFVLGLALGAVYVPCAGPVLAAITVAGATGNIGPGTIALTLAFAAGTAIPLLFFALAGRRVAERIKAFRRHQRGLRVTAGVLMLALAVGLVFNVPAALQRLVPDYTAGIQENLTQNEDVQHTLGLGGIVTDENRELSNCTPGSGELAECGTAPQLKGLTNWINTDGKPVNLQEERGKVVIVDFWAYSCINCQRSIPHLNSLYETYKDKGLEIVGVHTPEYAFEREPGNVAKGAQDLNIAYPVASDNGYETWTSYRNRYWPAHYLIDAKGTVRQIQFGEGNYQQTEQAVRQLLTDNGATDLPPAVETSNDGPDIANVTPETYLGVGKADHFVGETDTGNYHSGTQQFTLPGELPQDRFGLGGKFTLDPQGATAEQDDAHVKLHYAARNVNVVVSGEGTIEVQTPDGPKTIKVTGVPTSYSLLQTDDIENGTVDLKLTKGLKVYSFTFG